MASRLAPRCWGMPRPALWSYARIASRSCRCAIWSTCRWPWCCRRRKFGGRLGRPRAQSDLELAESGRVQQVANLSCRCGLMRRTPRGPRLYLRAGPESIGPLAAEERRPQAACRAARRGRGGVGPVGTIHADSRGHRRSPTSSAMNSQPNSDPTPDSIAAANVPPPDVRAELPLAAATAAGGGFPRFPLHHGTSHHGLEPRPGAPLAIDVTTVPLDAAAPRAIQIPIRRASIRVRSFAVPRAERNARALAGTAPRAGLRRSEPLAAG